MDLALDDIIDQKRKDHRYGGQRREGSRGGGFRRFSSNRNNNERSQVQFGSYRKRENGGNGGAFRRDRPYNNNRNSKPYNEEKNNGHNNDQVNDDVLNDDATLWGHDLFEKVQQGEETSIDFPAAKNLSLETGTKIRINNLDFNVTEDDLKDLFQQVGDVKKVKIHYDRSGRSEGSAEVIFARKGDADDAVKKYNNVELDGKSMKISLLGSALALSNNDFDNNRESFRITRGNDRGSRMRVQSSGRSVIRRRGTRGGYRR